ncbi:MAG: methyltransferase domain-containing protein [Rhodospirillaceae bacterium]
MAAPRDRPELVAAHFARLDEGPDEAFYEIPRLVAHIDDEACAALARHYARILSDGDEILDLMSSCVSHLPAGLVPGQVMGHGMNMAELEANPQLDDRFVQNLNADPRLPFGDASFDACLVAVSVQYLTRPVEVFRDVGRVLRPGGIVAISFSNRLFPTKAVALWRAMGDEGHCALVADYLDRTGRFQPAAVENLSADAAGRDPLYAVSARRRA